jgi:hypothetical protein
MSEEEEKIDSIVFNYCKKEVSTSIKLEIQEKDEDEKKNKQINNISLPENFSRNFVSSQLVDVKHKSDLGFKFVFNEIKNSQTDEENSKKLLELIQERGKIFMDNNLHTKERIANYSHSKRSQEFYKLEGENLEVYYKTIDLTTKAIYPNLVVKESKGKGHGVFTTAPLKPLTLLARYSGVVEMNHLTNTIKNTDQANHNDIFTLIETKNSKYDRVVNPSSHCNIARFLNHSNMQSQNVRSIRIVNPNEDMEILLYTCCQVKKGKELLYNYEEENKSYWKNFDKSTI